MKTQINLSQEQVQAIAIRAYAQAISAINHAISETVSLDDEADFSEIELVLGDVIFQGLKTCGNQLNAGEPELGVKMGAAVINAALEREFEFTAATEVIETPAPQPEVFEQQNATAAEVAETLKITLAAANAVIEGTEAIEEFCINNLPQEREITKDFNGTKFITNQSDDVDTLKICLSAFGVKTPKLNAAIKSAGADLLKTRTSMSWVAHRLYNLKMIS